MLSWRKWTTSDWGVATFILTTAVTFVALVTDGIREAIGWPTYSDHMWFALYAWRHGGYHGLPPFWPAAVVVWELIGTIAIGVHLYDYKGKPQLPDGTSG